MSRLSQLIAEYNETKRSPSEELMTQRRLAKLVGLHEVTVSRHVKGTHPVNLPQAVRYADALKVKDVRVLLEG